jgi:hypothetical protein
VDRDLQQRHKRVDFSVARPPVSPIFSSRAEPPALGGVNDFVVCSAIEPIRSMDLNGCKPFAIIRRCSRRSSRGACAGGEETPPIPMFFLQRLTTSSRAYKARFNADQNRPAGAARVIFLYSK